jgi:hypothetical protein
MVLTGAHLSISMICLHHRQFGRRILASKNELTLQGEDGILRADPILSHALLPRRQVSNLY